MVRGSVAVLFFVLAPLGSALEITVCSDNVVALRLVQTDGCEPRGLSDGQDESWTQILAEIAAREAELRVLGELVETMGE